LRDDYAIIINLPIICMTNGHSYQHCQEIFAFASPEADDFWELFLGFIIH